MPFYTGIPILMIINSHTTHVQSVSTMESSIFCKYLKMRNTIMKIYVNPMTMSGFKPGMHFMHTQYRSTAQLGQGGICHHSVYFLK